MSIKLFKYSCALYVDRGFGRVRFSFRFLPKSDGFHAEWVDGPWASIGPLVQFHIFDSSKA